MKTIWGLGLSCHHGTLACSEKYCLALLKGEVLPQISVRFLSWIQHAPDFRGCAAVLKPWKALCGGILVHFQQLRSNVTVLTLPIMIGKSAKIDDFQNDWNPRYRSRSLVQDLVNEEVESKVSFRSRWAYLRHYGVCPHHAKIKSVCKIILYSDY